MEFLKHTLNKSWGTFFYLGVLCIIGAVTGTFGIKGFSEPVKDAWSFGLFTLGAILLLFSAYREWMDSRAAALVVAPKKKVNPDKYEVEVLGQPKNGQKVKLVPGEPFTLKGKVEKNPEQDGFELWFLMAGQSKYWPGNKITIGDDNRWVLTHRPGPFKTGDFRLFRFVIAGPNGVCLLRDYKEIYEHPGLKDGPWAPISRLTDDIHKCLDHQVFLEEKPPIAPPEARQA